MKNLISLEKITEYYYAIILILSLMLAMLYGFFISSDRTINVVYQESGITEKAFGTFFNLANMLLCISCFILCIKYFNDLRIRQEEAKEYKKLINNLKSKSKDKIE